MGIWLDSHEHVNLDTGLTYTGGPAKFVFHTAEFEGLDGLIRTFRSNPTIASHMGWSWKERRKVQFIDLAHSAKSLRNKAGGVETNRDYVYQVELSGKWDESEDWPDEAWKFIGEALAEVWLATDRSFQLTLGPKPLVGPADGYTARENAPQRYSAAEWDGGNWIAGHCNAPENEHTDPGKLNMGRILYHCQKAITPEDIVGAQAQTVIAWTKPDSAWAKSVGIPGGAALLCTGATCKWLSPSAYTLQRFFGITDMGPLDDTWFACLSLLPDRVAGA
jgi:hypothetical protein